MFGFLLGSAKREWVVGDIVTRYLVGKHLGWSPDEIARRIRRLYGIPREERLIAMAPEFDALCSRGISTNPTDTDRDGLNIQQLVTEALEHRGLLKQPELHDSAKIRKQALFVAQRVDYHISITPTVLQKGGHTMAEFATRLKW